MVPIRCGHCGQNCYYREGMRHCSGCAASIVTPCTGCGRDVFFGDRFCMFCAVPLATGPGPGYAAAADAAPVPVDLPAGDIAALRVLAAEAHERAAESASRKALPSKQHLDQTDIDAMFG